MRIVYINCFMWRYTYGPECTSRANKVQQLYQRALLVCFAPDSFESCSSWPGFEWPLKGFNKLINPRLVAVDL